MHSSARSQEGTKNSNHLRLTQVLFNTTRVKTLTAGPTVQSIEGTMHISSRQCQILFSMLLPLRELLQGRSLVRSLTPLSSRPAEEIFAGPRSTNNLAWAPQGRGSVKSHQWRIELYKTWCRISLETKVSTYKTASSQWSNKRSKPSWTMGSIRATWWATQLMWTSRITWLRRLSTWWDIQDKWLPSSRGTNPQTISSATIKLLILL